MMESNPDMIREAMRMAQSEEGQQLLKLLQQSGGPQLNQAMRSAAEGNYDSAKHILKSLLQDPKTRELLQKMGGNHGSDGR